MPVSISYCINNGGYTNFQEEGGGEEQRVLIGSESNKLVTLV